MSYIGHNVFDIVNIKDNRVGTQLLDKLTRIKGDRRIKPLDYFENVMYTHRIFYNSYNLQIGDSYFMIPPEFIMITSESTSQSIVTLRQENTQKQKSGYHRRTIMIDLVFNGIDQINGFRVEGPESVDGKDYYIDGLRPLMAQFKCTPFLPITNELINRTYGIFTVALQSINISTVPGYADVLKAQIILQEVCMFPYLEAPDYCFRHMIDWDLFRYYYQSFMTETHKYKRLQSLPANKEHNKFRLSILDSMVFDDEKVTEYNVLNVVLDNKILKKDENGNDCDTNYTPWIDSYTSDVVISSFQCGYMNILTNIQMAELSAPTLQFLGGMDTIYNITFETTDEKVIQSLEQCQISNDLMLRSNPKIRSSIGFVKLESELVEFTGSLFVMIESVETNTVPGFPGLYNVQINCVSYDVAQSERESLHGFKPFACEDDCDNDWDSDCEHSEQAIDQERVGWKRKIRQDNYAEWKLRTQMEVYPDLRLPTYQEVDDILDKIATFRKDKELPELPYTKYPTRPAAMLHGCNPGSKATFDYTDTDKTMIDILSIEREEYDGYVDPDFYVFYPVSYESYLDEDETYYDALNPPQQSGYTKLKNLFKAFTYTLDGIASTVGTEQFIALATSFEGCEYVLGTEGGEGEIGSNGRPTFDCSGLISYCLAAMGVTDGIRFTTSTMKDKTEYFEVITLDEIKRGDLVWRSAASSYAAGGTGHVAIYLGEDKIFHASGKKTGVCYGTFNKAAYECGLRIKSFIGSGSANVGTGSASYDNVEQVRDQDLGNFTMPTVEEMNEWINSKAPANSPFRNQGAVFIKAAQESGLDPRYILAHAALESAWGTSSICQKKHNYFGIGAIDNDPYNKAHTFDEGLENGIVEGAKWISKYYYNGNYGQTTLRKMRWNNGVHQYATDTEWDTKIAKIMVGAPAGSGGSVGNTGPVMYDVNELSQSEFDSICRTVMKNTLGETEAGEKAFAQFIYDRMTDENARFGNLSYILSQLGSYGGDITDSVKNNVEAVFVNNEKYNEKVLLYSLTADDSWVEIDKYDTIHTRICEIDTHIYWGSDVNSSDKKYTVVEKKSTPSSDGTFEAFNVGTYTLESSEYFAEPVVIDTEYYRQYASNLFGGKNTGNNVSKNWRDNVNSTENVFNTAFCDMYQYSSRGRLVKAFPTYLFCILDDDASWFDGRKLWTNYYTHQSVVDIAIHGTNDMPTETATIIVNNSYHNLDRTQGGLGNYSILNDDEYSDASKWVYKYTGMLMSGFQFGPKLTSTLIKLHQIIYAHAKLREGARVHLRIGYGSDPLSLAPVMNGHVSEVALGDQVQIVVTSDAHELIQHVVSAKEGDTNNGWLGIFGIGEKQESSNIIADIMCKRSSWLTYLTKGSFEMSKYSIEHYGLFERQNLGDNPEEEEEKEYIEETTDEIFADIIEDIAIWIESGCQDFDRFKEIMTAHFEKLGKRILQDVEGNIEKAKEAIVEAIDKFLGGLDKAIEGVFDGADWLFENLEKIPLIGVVGWLLDGAIDGVETVYDWFKKGTTYLLDMFFKNEGGFRDFIIGAALGALTTAAIVSTAGLATVPAVITTIAGTGIGGGIGVLVGSKDIGVSDIWNEYIEQYDICKNIYRASYKRILYCHNDVDETPGDGEMNIVFTRYNMTPWDMFQMCTQQVPEYIMKSEYHQFDSRLYFGLPFWMSKYRYDVLYDSDGNEKIVEECKTASQVHLLDSMDNIIDNQVRVTSKHSFTNIKVMYLRGSSSVSTMEIHSDDTIDMSKQKTKILDTPIVQDALGPDLIWEIVGYDVGDESARRVGISNLLYGWQQQYQGQIITLGNPGVKPHDYIMVNDTYTNLFGVAIVREVTHSFNTNTGFTTSITPGMVGFSTDENSGMIEVTKTFLAVLSCFASYTSTRRGMYQNYEATLGVWGDAATLVSLAQQRFDYQASWQKHQTGIGIFFGVTDLLQLAGASKNFWRGGKMLYHAAKGADFLKDGIDMVKAFDKAKDLWNSIKGIKNIAKGMYAAVTGGSIAGAPATGGLSIIIGAVVNTAIWLTIDVVLDSFFEWFSNKNVCVLCPMWWEGYPFVAGVKDGEKILLMPSNSTSTDENTREDAYLAKGITSQDIEDN